MFVLAVAAGDLTLVPLIQLRLATVVMLGVALLAVWSARGTPWLRPAPLALLSFALVAAAWAPLALSRAPDPVEGRAEVQGFLAGIAVAVAVVALSRCSRIGLVGMRRGWMLALGLSVLVATYELITKDHLWLSPGLDWAESHRTIVAGAFRNPNDFAIALTAMISGTLAGAASRAERRRGWRRAVPIVLCVLGAIAVLLTESRSGLLALIVVLAIHLGAAVWNRRRLGVSPAALAGGGLVALVGVVAAFTVPALAAHNPVLRTLIAAGEPGTARSDTLRLDLIRAGWRYLRESDGLGTGAASFEVLLARDPNPGVSTHTWLHNSFLEIVLQYGVVVGGALGLVLLIALAAVRRRGAVDGSVARVEVLASITCFAALAFASATVVTAPVWWLILGQAVASAWWLDQGMPRGA